MSGNEVSADIGTALLRALQAPNPVLFAGAGVGIRVGLPSWLEFVNHMAEVCTRFGDHVSAESVRDRASRGRFLEASSAYRNSDLIPEGERWKLLVAPFGTPIPDAELDKLEPLVQLPFQAVVTTNYDKSLLDSWARCHGRMPTTFNRSELAHASLYRQHFIARIHGRAEDPSSIVFDPQSYEAACADMGYVDFVMSLLRQRSVTFVGFSFLDPAIQHIIKLYKNRHSPRFEALHTALIPAGGDDLAAELRSANVEVVFYDPDGAHAALWRGIRAAYGELRALHPTQPIRPIAVKAANSSTHRLLAFAYAQMLTKRDAAPLATLARDSVVASMIADRRGAVIEISDLVPKVAQVLGVTAMESTSLISTSIARLEKRELVESHETLVQWVGCEGDGFESDIGQLSQSIIDRMRVREGVLANDHDRIVAARVVENLLVARAWDMSAQLAGAAAIWPSDIDAQVAQSIAQFSSDRRLVHGEQLARAISNLLCAPDGAESSILVGLARAAFGLQLIVSSPRQTLLHAQALPELVYLDANILLPLVARGHPLRPAYVDALERLTMACREAQKPLRVVVGRQFLNEVVSHRQIAVELAETLGLDDPERLARHIAFYGAVNTNVYIGGYASVVGREKKQVAFRKYMEASAPYINEEQLASYLRQDGIETVDLTPDEEHRGEAARIVHTLESAYERREGASHRGRARVLLVHEADQLLRLAQDRELGIRSLFVTAHGRFRRVLREDGQLETLSNLTMSHVGLVAMAEVLSSKEPDARALARLLWMAPAVETESTLFDYFIDCGLRRYREGLGTDIAQVAKRVAHEATVAAEVEQLHLGSGDTDDHARTAKFLDRFEDRFYELYRSGLDRAARD